MSKKTLQESGIVYCATGKELFLKEAYISINSIKKFNKNIKISIFIDEKNLKILNKDLFDTIHLIKSPEYGFGDKIYSMSHTPYRKTLYLDCDTIVADDLSEIFSLLEKFDIAAINVPFKNNNYPDFNAGIIAFNMNERTRKFIELWDKRYDRLKHGTDQGAFTKMLKLNIVSFFALPPEYNFRIPFVSYVQNKIKIFHSHELIKLNEKKRESIINFINLREKERLWFPGKGLVLLDQYKNLLTKFLNFLEEKFYEKVSINPRKLFIIELLRKNLLRFNFKWILDWLLPYYYREKIKRFNQLLNEFI